MTGKESTMPARARSLAALVLALAAAALPARRAARADDARAATPSAAALLESADRARGGLARGITWSVTLTSEEDGDRSERGFLVRARGNDAHVESRSPPRTKGEVMLFNDRTIWYVKPGLRKPVSISARQRLQGLAANGDIASTRYARDYDGTVDGSERVGGVDAWRLELKAKAKDVTYDRIRYWISKDDELGVQAEFLTRDGKVMKTARFEYESEVVVDGTTYAFVSKMTITDAASKDRTEIVYGPPKLEDHPASMFNVNNILR
jgi:negative regulator of sigma E activity